MLSRQQLQRVLELQFRLSSFVAVAELPHYLQEDICSSRQVGTGLFHAPVTQDAISAHAPCNACVTQENGSARVAPHAYLSYIAS